MRRCEVLFAVTVSLGSACSMAPSVDAGCFSCATWDRPVAQGTLPLELSELSGLVASARTPGVLFAHNDSGDTARFFAIDEHGSLLGTFFLPDAGAIDWEDVGRGPCDAGSCLFFGDIGDNDHLRGRYAILRVPEPAIPASAGPAEAVPFTRLDFTYPDGGAPNAEALFVHPLSGDLYVLSKEASGVPSEVYVLRHAGTRGAGSTEAEWVAQLPFPTASDDPITGADVNACGTRVLVRLYDGLVELSVAGGQPFESIFQSALRRVTVAAEPQGEAIAYARDGAAFFTGSERLNPTEPLYRSGCRP